MSSQPVVVTFDDGDQALLAKWTIKNVLKTGAEPITSEAFSHESFDAKWRLLLRRNEGICEQRGSSHCHACNVACCV